MACIVSLSNWCCHPVNACNQHMRINENHSRSINWSELLSAFLSQLKTTTLMIILSRIKRKESLSYLRFANPWLQNYSGCNCQKLSFFFSFPTFCSRSGHYLLPLTKSSKVNDFDILWLHISELMVGECAFFLKKRMVGELMGEKQKRQAAKVDFIELFF
jgi:hypothetical protein